MKRLNNLFVLIFLLAITIPGVQAQSNTDSVKQKKDLKNTIRLNITAPLLFGSRNFILGYERVISKNQTMSLNGGQAAFPKLINLGSFDSIGLAKNNNKGGYNFSLDYRFYLGKLNKYSAPRGVYAGPYIAYVHFVGDNDWQVNNDAPNPPRSVNTKTTFNVFTVGGELGYQFVFWRRFAVDLVLIGPGISRYNFSSKITGSILTTEEKEKLQEKLTQAIENRFPGMNYVFDDQTLKGNGSISTTSVGFRYIIHIGFRF
jgi:hypothetical protein